MEFDFKALKEKVLAQIALDEEDKKVREIEASGVLTHRLLLSLVSYDPLTGLFTHKVGRLKGQEAGTVNGRGYVDIKLRQKIYQAHRLAWFYTYGEWPKLEIDHKNRIRTDNKIDNLRDVSHQVNSMNKEKKNV